jgi:ubiquinone biosynthesis protein COQ4
MLAQATIDTSLHPFEAVRAVRRLLANPEDTSQVFAIFRALRGKSGLNAFRRFAASPTGARIIREKRRLLDTLSDRARLAALPQKSFGRCYFNFMEEEQLTAEGLVEASQSWETDPVPADVQLFRERMRDAHDLTHVLTGYGRDPLGELCLLAFTYTHTGNLGMALIVLIGYLQINSWPVRHAVLEAWRHGRAARLWFPDTDWESLLPQQLEDLRRRFAIAAPTAYHAAMP